MAATVLGQKNKIWKNKKLCVYITPKPGARSVKEYDMCIFFATGLQHTATELETRHDPRAKYFAKENRVNETRRLLCQICNSNPLNPGAPHPTAAPLTERSEDALAIAANGTRTCIGGWQVVYSGTRAGKVYEIVAHTQFQDVDHARDVLRCEAYWGHMPRDNARRNNVLSWDYLLPEWNGNTVQFSRRLTAPKGADHLTVRYTFRWSIKGASEWQLPNVTVHGQGDSSKPVKICVATGRREDRNRRFASIQDNVDLYASLCRSACEREKPDLIVLPEIALQYGIQGSPLDLAVPVPSADTAPFSDLARDYGIHVLLGAIERDGDAVYNTAALFAPNGGIAGKYRKVHLAVGGEMDSGILPGDDFPVFDTAIGRIGCNICMDSSAAESSRMIGLNGADFLLLPIMGDHRAWHPEDHTWTPNAFAASCKRARWTISCAWWWPSTAQRAVASLTAPGMCWPGTMAVSPFVTAEVDLADGFRRKIADAIAASTGCNAAPMRTAFQSMKQTRAACALKRIDGEWNNPRHRQRRYAVNAIDDIRAEQVQRRGKTSPN